MEIKGKFEKVGFLFEDKITHPNQYQQMEI